MLDFTLNSDIKRF